MVFNSLRTKLVAAFALVIFLSLTLSSAGAVLLLRDYQRQLRLNQLADMSLPISYQIGALERLGASQGQIGLFLQEQARQTGVRILLVNRVGTIVEDSQGELTGEEVDTKNYDLILSRPALSRPSPAVQVYRSPHGLVMVSSPYRPTSQLADRFLTRVPSYSVVMAVPQQQVASAWLELAPHLSLAALVSLAASVLVALFLSRSISRPILQIARASEEMAQGRYDQFISTSSRDEIGMLARSFNNMAEKVSSTNRTLRDFLANVSHELKTPLTSIQGFSQALVDGAVKDQGDYEEAGRIINDEANRMRRLVDDLLYLSRIESGQVEFEIQPIDLSDLLENCCRKVARQVEEAGITLGTQIQPSVTIPGDVHRLENVFGNILENAIKHTPSEGSITVRLQPAEPRAANEVQKVGASIVVHNTGSVIPADELPRVFDRFYQVKGVHTRSNEGSGLGLAIVKEIVQAHRGTVSVHSEAASGTEFVVMLPGRNNSHL